MLVCLCMCGVAHDSCNAVGVQTAWSVVADQQAGEEEMFGGTWQRALLALLGIYTDCTP